MKYKAIPKLSLDFAYGFKFMGSFHGSAPVWIFNMITPIDF